MHNEHFFRAFSGFAVDGVAVVVRVDWRRWCGHTQTVEVTIRRDLHWKVQWALSPRTEEVGCSERLHSPKQNLVMS